MPSSIKNIADDLIVRAYGIKPSTQIRMTNALIVRWVIDVLNETIKQLLVKGASDYRYRRYFKKQAVTYDGENLFYLDLPCRMFDLEPRDAGIFYFAYTGDEARTSFVTITRDSIQ